MSNGPAGEVGNAERVSRLFNDLLGHQAFKSAPVLRSILLYLWQHQGEPVGEYAIAVDALGRRPDFDPKVDASVRVLIGRLRARLKEFNSTEAYPLKLRIPLGTHEIQWSLEEQANSLASAPSLAGPPREGLPAAQVRPAGANNAKFFWGVASLAAALAVVCAFLLWQNRSLVSQRSPVAGVGIHSSIPVPRFWKSFLSGTRPPIIVLPSPVYSIWPDKNLVVRDLAVSDAADWSKSPMMHEFAKAWGAPRLTQGYIALRDMQAGMQFVHFFNTLGIGAELIDSSHFQRDTQATTNSIFLGFPNRAGYLRSQMQNTDFYVSGSVTSPVVVHDRAPAAGQPSEYREVDYSGSHKIYPGLIVFPPPRSDRTRTLILVGMLPGGLASALVTPAGLELVTEQWRSAGSPEAWEMVVEEEIHQSTILRAWPVAIRAIASRSH